MNIKDKYHASLKYQELIKLTGKKLTTLQDWFTRNHKSVLNEKDYTDYLEYFRSGKLRAWRPIREHKL